MVQPLKLAVEDDSNARHPYCEHAEAKVCGRTARVGAPALTRAARARPSAAGLRLGAASGLGRASAHRIGEGRGGEAAGDGQPLRLAEDDESR